MLLLPAESKLIVPAAPHTGQNRPDHQGRAKSGTRPAPATASEGNPPSASGQAPAAPAPASNGSHGTTLQNPDPRQALSFTQRMQASLLTPVGLLAGVSLLLGLILVLLHLRLRGQLRREARRIDTIEAGKTHLRNAQLIAHLQAQQEKFQAELLAVSAHPMQSPREPRGVSDSRMRERRRALEARLDQTDHALERNRPAAPSGALEKSLRIAVDRNLALVEEQARFDAARADRLRPLAATLRASLNGGAAEARLAALRQQWQQLDPSRADAREFFAACDRLEGELAQLPGLQAPDPEQLPGRVMDWASRELLEARSDWPWQQVVAGLLTAFSLNCELPSPGHPYVRDLHELVDTRPGGGFSPGQIVEVVAAGFCHRETGDVERKARVIVAAAGGV